ncbi:hypothetical protein ES703_61364 [subsurface metagenome]
MGSQNVGVTGVNQGILKTLLKEGIGVMHKILVKRVIQTDKKT